MKVDRLISELQALKAKYPNEDIGGIEVWVSNCDGEERAIAEDGIDIRLANDMSIDHIRLENGI